MKEHLSTLYTKTGKLKDGMTVQRDFTEERITVPTSLRKKVDEKLLFLENVEKKCKDMFRGQLKKFKSKKRSRKETIERPKKEKLPEKKIILI